jgi:type III restriction enzyme
MRTLQTILDQLPYDALPPAWTTFDLAAFSRNKRLWEYQQDALHGALKALWKYYEDFGDYHPGERDDANAARKGQMFQWYRHNGLPTNLDIPLGRKRAVRALLLEHYEPLGDKIPFEYFINRLGFWMATGSGKTLVIVKLIELLWRLARLEEIPGHNILVLTHRDDLLGQLRSHVDEFNAARHGLHIRLEELRNYSQVRRFGGSLFRHNEVTVFTYRSDNLSDVQKEKIVNYRNYDNDGRWYVLLDEAHKGDKEESKRQHIYSILARNGFLFNFSATFTDERDQVTTAYDFNLARFIQAGYGKHISILTQENRAFRPDEDYSDEEKQKVVLKALLLLTYAQRSYGRLPGGWYHRPLLLTLVNSVNVKDSDLKLFFRQLARIGKGQISQDVWQQVKEELRLELASRPELLFERQRFLLDEELFQSLQIGDLLACVFNVDAGAAAAAAGGGEIEALVRPSNRQEIALSLKAADRPFALIKIGDISGWLKEELSGYTVVEGYGNDSFFQRLNADDSPINILLGSRSFYEGWDSNRPNVITFINIGVGLDARKFILQAVGRGVRVEPLPGQRRRLAALYNAGQISETQFTAAHGQALPLETVFILGTNRQALHTVIEQMDQQGGKDASETLALAVNAAAQGRTLLIPTYRSADHRLVEERSPRKFEIAADELARLQSYAAHLADQRLLVTTYRATPAETQLLQRCLAEPVRYFRTDTTRRYGSMDVLVPRLLRYFHIIPREMDGLKTLEDEIRHFQHITVLLKPMADALRHEIANVSLFPQRQQREAQLREQFASQQLSFDDLLVETAALNQIRASAAVNALEVRYVANHYYVPVILANDQKIDYIQHIIRAESEVRFVRQLEAYAQSAGNALDRFDWWLFSKLDETLDTVYLPYYDPEANRIREFKPDFVFWLQRGTDYHVVFVDPKGTKISDYQRKVDDYRRVFEQPSGRRKVFEHDGLRVQVSLALTTEDKSLVGQGYAAYWADHPDQIFSRLVTDPTEIAVAENRQSVRG